MKFRASWSILSQWASGNYDNAIRYYYKLDSFTSPEMVEGKKWHDKWSSYIDKHKALPKELGGDKLISPITEKKSVVKIEDWLDFVYKPDAIDGFTLYEFKTGKKSSEFYARQFQIGVYAVGSTLDGMNLKIAKLIRYDQYKNKHDVSSVWITDKLLKDSLEWIHTNSSEMFNYIQENNLEEKFK